MDKKCLNDILWNGDKCRDTWCCTSVASLTVYSKALISDLAKAKAIATRYFKISSNIDLTKNKQQ